MPEPFCGARLRARTHLHEWLVLVPALLALVLWLSPAQRLGGINHTVQDAALRWHAPRASPDIAIVAIDDASLAAIGRWPWRRALHAQLLQNVTAQQPRAIGLDLLLTDADPDHPADDALLAQAMAASGRVALPLVQRSYGWHPGADLPLPLFAQAAAALGHVHAVVDSDGVVRSLYLREGLEGAPWPHLSVALQCAGGAALPACAAQPSPTLAPASPGHTAARPWVQQQPLPIAFADPAQPFTRYSYIDVLRGQLPEGALTGKYVLIGAVATGMGDLFATPSPPTGTRMPGVEIVAHALNTQRAGAPLQPVSTMANAAFNALPVLLALAGLWWLGPTAALALIGTLLLATTALALAAPLWAGVLLAPAGALVGLVLAYPLWSWRRLHRAARFLHLELERQQRAGVALGAGTSRRGDFLERRMGAVEQATRQLRDLHRFVHASLEQLPSATLVCDTGGAIVLANAAARDYGASLGLPALPGLPLTHLLQGLRDASGRGPWRSGAPLHPHQLPAHSEGRDAQGRHLLVLCKPFNSARSGWLVTLVDWTAMRQAQAQRDQALHFISHDIRAPNASILTLLEMQRAYPGELAPSELLARIERYAQTSLGMAERFVQLASAQSQPLGDAAVDLAGVLQEAIDDAWVQAREQGVQVTLAPCPEGATSHGNAALLRRALANLLSNAIKYSPCGASVRCSLQADGPHWVLAVQDEGPGIARALQERLFVPFARLHTQSHPDIAGIGLGLALVQTVAQRHGGTLEVDSEAGQGAQFRLRLPQSPPQTQAPAEPALYN